MSRQIPVEHKYIGSSRKRETHGGESQHAPLTTAQSIRISRKEKIPTWMWSAELSNFKSCYCLGLSPVIAATTMLVWGNMIVSWLCWPLIFCSWDCKTTKFLQITEGNILNGKWHNQFRKICVWLLSLLIESVFFPRWRTGSWWNQGLPSHGRDSFSPTSEESHWTCLDCL